LINNNVYELIKAFQQIALKNQKEIEFKSWIQDKIYQTGKVLYQNNLPDSIYDVQKLMPFFIICLDQKLAQTLMETKINAPIMECSRLTSDNTMLFLKFLEALHANIEKYEREKTSKPIQCSIFVILSYSVFLDNNDVNINIYNLKSVDFLVDYVDLSLLLQNSGMDLVNSIKEKTIQNNASFINPISTELAHHFLNKSWIFDIHFSKSINIEKIRVMLENLLRKIYNKI